MRRLGANLNDAVLPFYVLHETVVVAIASIVLTWKLAPGAQYLLISIASLVATLLLCELGVRRSPITRVLFGLKPIRRPSPQSRDQSGTSSGGTVISDRGPGESMGAGHSGEQRKYRQSAPRAEAELYRITV